VFNSALDIMIMNTIAGTMSTSGTTYASSGDENTVYVSGDENTVYVSGDEATNNQLEVRTLTPIDEEDAVLNARSPSQPLSVSSLPPLMPSISPHVLS